VTTRDACSTVSARPIGKRGQAGAAAALALPQLIRERKADAVGGSAGRRSRPVGTAETPKRMNVYDRKFFAKLAEEGRCSARALLPVLLEIYRPTSVVDVGCGSGTWLAVSQELGIGDVFGIDGAYVDPLLLEIPSDRFLSTDLAEPLVLSRRFDLVVCLEVAEHLPAASAETLVESLTQLGPVVLFGAAIPHQGGVNHINEQWPEYWTELFRNRGYVLIDCIRPQIWNNEEIMWWYRQNTLLFVQHSQMESVAALREAARCPGLGGLALVHPESYLGFVNAPTSLAKLRLRLARRIDRLRRLLSRDP
jgi:SAM-dependent methyltransferase